MQRRGQASDIACNSSGPSALARSAASKLSHPVQLHRSYERHPQVLQLFTYLRACCAMAQTGLCHAGVVPSATFQTKDGRYVIIGGNGDSIYTRLMTAVGRPDMGSSNPLYKSNSDRCRHEKEIYAVSHHSLCSIRA